jgi:hypothetical protein
LEEAGSRPNRKESAGGHVLVYTLKHDDILLSGKEHELYLKRWWLLRANVVPAGIVPAGVGVSGGGSGHRADSAQVHNAGEKIKKEVLAMLRGR